MTNELVMRIIFSCNVAVSSDAVEAGANIGIAVTEDTLELFERPDVKGPLAFFGVGLCRVGVGVLGAVEASARGSNWWACQVCRNIIDCSKHFWVMCDKKGIQIDIQELCLVVKHLFEMWKTPVRRHRIPREAVPNLIPNASSCHSTKGMDNHFRSIGAFLLPYNVLDCTRPLPEPEKKAEVGWSWELWCIREATIGFVVSSLKMLVGFF